jgi:hypothetical protein
MVMDAGAASAADCSFGNRDSMFGGSCRTEQGFRNRDGQYRFGPRYDENDDEAVEVEAVEEAVVEEEKDRKWGHDRRGKRYGKHHGKRHGKRHGGWDNDDDKGGKHHGKRGGWDNDNDNDGKHGKGRSKGKSKGGYGSKSKGGYGGMSKGGFDGKGKGRGKDRGPAAPM